MLTRVERISGAGARDTASPIEVGTRVYTCLYNRGEGIVYAISDEPEVNIPGVRVIRSDGFRKQFDIVFLCGSRSLKLPEIILRGVQWRILDKAPATAEEIAAAQAFADEQEAAKKAAEIAAASAREAELARLKTSPDYAHLTQGDDRYSGKLAASNIRAELKKAHPGVKFSVKKTGHGSVSVSWTDGPTGRVVDAIVGRYQRGHFDGMQDIYEDARPAWCDVFGGAQYVFTRRSESDELIKRAIAAVFARFAGNLVDVAAPSAEDYRQGRTNRIEIPHLGDTLERYIREQISKLEA